MAIIREYAYYWEGNRIAIVERDTAFDNDVNSKDYGPGSDRAQWRSPKAAVTNGLEIQYSYAPTYRVNYSGADELAKFHCNGWYTDIDGYLNIARSGKDWDGVAVSGVGISNDKYIYIGGSSRWSGIHKVKAVGTEQYHGNIQLHTKVDFQDGYISDSDAIFGTDETITTTGQPINDVFSTSDYIWIYGDESMTINNTGMFSISSLSETVITVGKRYAIETSAAAENKSPEDYIDEATPVWSSETKDVKIYKVHYDPFYITAAENMEDESFVIDLQPYLNKALVYYVKAKLLEDVGDLEKREYFMKQFHKQIEKYNNSKVSGIRIIASGPLAIR